MRSAALFCTLAILSVPAFSRPFRVTDLTDTANRFDYLIICADSLAAGAESLAAYRHANPRDRVENPGVVHMSDVITSFPDSALYRDRLRQFILFSLDNWDQGPSAILLMGDAVPDTGTLINTSPVPSFTWVNGSSASADDGWLVSRNGLMEIPAGRLPAGNLTEIMNAVDKIKEYESPGYTRSNRICLAADDEYNPDTGSDYEMYFTQGMEHISSLIAPAFTKTKKYGITYPAITDNGIRRLPEMTADLTGEINKGLFILDLYGHGNPVFFTHEKVLTADSVLFRISNREYPIINFSSCHPAAFHRNERTILEHLLFADDKGCIAAIGATGDMNGSILMRFTGLLYNWAKQTPADIGTLFCMAKNSTASSGIKYQTLLGDPALVLPISFMTMDQPDTIKTDSSVIRLSGTIGPVSSGTLTGIVWQEQPAVEETLGSGGTVTYIPDPAAVDSFTADIISGSFSHDYHMGVPVESTVYKITLRAQDDYSQALGAVFVKRDDHAGFFSPAPVGHQPLAVSPNPFRGAASFTLPRGESSRIIIYSLAGQLIRTLNTAPGRDAVRWDGRDQRGNTAAPGVYHCIMESGNTTRSARLIKSN